MEKEISLPLWRMEEIEAKLAKFAKLAKKWGYNAPQIRYTGDPYFTRVMTDNSGHNFCRVEMQDAILTFDEIVAPGGYRFVGAIEKTPAGNLISGPGKAGLEHLRTVEHFTCEHCNTNRYRRYYYVVANDEGSMIVGKSCIRQFFNQNLAEQIAAMRLVGQMDDWSDEFEGGGGGDYPATVTVKEAAAMTMAFVRRVGYKSSRYIADWEIPTWREVSEQLLTPPDRLKANKIEQLVPNADELTLADQIMVRWQAIAAEVEADKEAADEWDYLKYLFIKNGFITAQPRQLGRVVGMFYNECRQMGIEVQRAVSAQSEHFGTVKERMELDVTITNIRMTDGMWGSKEMIKGVIKGTSNVFIWWNSGQFHQFSEGDYRIKATVKDHTEHSRYGKQTVLKNVKKVEV